MYLEKLSILYLRMNFSNNPRQKFMKFFKVFSCKET